MAVRVGYQGMPGAYSQSALLAMAPTADVLAGKEIETVPVSSFKSLLTMVQQRELSYAIVPIDNSLSGSFHNVYELLVEVRPPRPHPPLLMHLCSSTYVLLPSTSTARSCA